MIDIELIVQSIMGLVALLALLLFFLFLTSSTKPKEQKKKVKVTKKKKQDEKSLDLPTDLESLRAIIKNKQSTAQELRKAIDLVVQYHGTIHTKLGIRAHPDFDPYMDMLFTICRHPNADKDMIISFEKELGKLNPEYKQDINDAITKGLNSRRV
jgi:hypothetical protein